MRARAASIDATIVAPSSVVRKRYLGTGRALSFALLFAGATAGASAAMTRHLPTGEMLRQQITRPQIRVNSELLVADRKKEFMASAVCYCFLPIESTSIPTHVKNALIATEDRRFREHSGFDLRGIARALSNLGRGELQGGSTITQQLAKAMVVGANREFPAGILRKIREVVVALRLERLLTKDEILTAYLNMADFGASEGWTAFGIEQAARKYFGKSASALNIYEGAQLVGVLNGTTRFNPDLEQDRARDRTKLVLQRMVDQEFIKQRDADRVLRDGAHPGKRDPVRVKAGYYLDWVFDELVVIAAGRKLHGDVRVVVGLDAIAQIRAEAVVADALNAMPAGSAIEAALVAMQPDGRVLAMVGGKDYGGSQFNRAVKASRQPGSTFKLFVYAAALDAGMAPDSIVVDGPLRSEDGWPANSDGRYRGPVKVQDAIAHSLNGAAVHTATKIGMSRVVAMARQLGIPGNIGLNPSVALGSHGLRLIELTAAYGVFANEGRRVLPYGVLQATDSRGYLFYDRQPLTGGPVVQPRVVSQIRSMLRNAIVSGTGRNARLSGGRFAAGKTGTSSDNRDALFVGFTDEVVTGIWFGNDDSAPMTGVSGLGAPAATWRSFNEDMRRLNSRPKTTETRNIEVMGIPPVSVVPIPRPRLGETLNAHNILPAPDALGVSPVPSHFQRQTVPYGGQERPGTILVKTQERYLYLVEENGLAIRYPIGVGRAGFTWSGTRTITAKREWPDWFPPAGMRKRRPELPKQVPGGPNNPLGARALYLGSSIYRIHGSNEPSTIGQPVSSGCFRMRNEDAVDLYDRVSVGTRVIVE